MSRRVPDYYSPYSPQYPEDYQYYPPGVRPDSICSMPAYERVSPPWALEDKRHSFRNGGTYQLRDWKEHPGFGRQDVPLWLPAPGRQPTYLDEVDAASGSLRRMSLQPRSRSVPRSPSQGSYARARVYSPVRSPSARFERLPPRGDEIYADPTTFMMRRSISSPKVTARRCLGCAGSAGDARWGCQGRDAAAWSALARALWPFSRVSGFGVGGVSSLLSTTIWVTGGRSLQECTPTITRHPPPSTTKWYVHRGCRGG